MANDDQIYRNTLDHLLQGFQIIGPDWTYLYVNPAAAEHGRRTPAELEGRKMWEAYPGIEQAPFFVLMRRCMEERVPAFIENLFTFPDGTTRWFELRIEAVPQGVCVHSIDIDDRKKAQTELQHVNDELELRVATRTRELETANRELEAYGYTVSHDLRAPLRAIDGFAQALSEDCSEQLDEPGLEHLARIRAAAQRMAGLIDDLLMLSRMGRAAVTRAEVDISGLAREIADELEQRDPARRVEWRIASGLSAECDLRLTRIVLENLLGNAWKFTSRTANARIEVRKSDDEPHAFVVADNGPGFDMQFVGKLFRPFQRLHIATEFPGSGIGLATVQRIVERHGGSVRAAAVPDQGATFSFTLEP
jgi:PAS domain S-box-containing protein